MKMNITNEFELPNNLMVFEIKNNVERTYDYYIFLENHPLQFSFGVPWKQPNGLPSRFDQEQIENLYWNGGFNYELEELGFEDPEEESPSRYWFDPEYNYGDFSVRKFALYEVSDNGDEKIVLWASYDDVPNYPEDPDENLADAWEAIDEYIEEQLGFLPDYEVG